MEAFTNSKLGTKKFISLISRKFWVHFSGEQLNHGSSKGPKPPFSPSREQLFTEAVETLQQLKTTFSPLEKLLVIRSTFEQLTQVNFDSFTL